MRSSPASVASGLEVPALTWADRAGVAAPVLAALFVAWACWRQDQRTPAAAWCLAAGALLAWHLLRGRLARRRAPSRLVPDAEGNLWLHRAGEAACRVVAGPGTRLIGPSVFLDLRATNPVSGVRIRVWITLLDVPRDALRRWSVVLPRSGRVACS